jgi:PAS domain S-box-containing protein
MTDEKNNAGAETLEDQFDDHIELTRHSPEQKRRHLIQIMLTVLFLSSLYPFFMNNTDHLVWSNKDIHGTMQTVGALLGIATGFFFISRSISFGNRFHLFIGLAFAVSGFADFFHGIISLGGANWLTNVSNNVVLNPVTAKTADIIFGAFVAGRLLLGGILMLALYIPGSRLLSGESKNYKLEALWVSVVVVLSSVLITVVLTALPLTQLQTFYWGIVPIFKPLDLITALILLLALSEYMRKYWADSDMLTWWISVAIAVNIVSQFFMGFSTDPYDPLFFISDAYKVFGYLIPLVGYSQYQIGSLNERMWSEMKLKRGTEVLEETVSERTIALEKLNDTLREELAERKLAEERMSRIAAELELFIETANAPIFGLDGDGHINKWNKNAVTVTGISTEEALGRHFVNEFITDDSRNQARDVFSNVFRGDEAATFEVSMNVHGSRKVIFLLSATTRRDIDGNIIGLMGFGQDITELTKYRQKLEKLVEERTGELNKALIDTAEARDRIDAILKSVADGLIVTDTFNRVILMNRASEDLLSIRLSDVINRSIDYAIQDETLREKVKHTLNKKTTGYQFDFEIPGDNPERPRVMRARTSVILSREGVESGIVTIMHDVTAAREVERMKTEFLSTAAHELRTPLTSIQGFSEILLTRDNIKDEDRTRYMTYINKQAVNLAGIVNDLLDISRIESREGFLLEKMTTDICEDIRSVIPYFLETSEKHTFVVDLPDQAVELFIDREKMGQVLKNVLSNAVKYAPDGGLIKVVGKKDKDFFNLSVTDEGIGMTPDQVDKVFEKFYRVNAGDSAPEGTGLGTTILKYIVESHGGEVNVESEFGVGTTFSYRLPLS